MNPIGSVIAAVSDPNLAYIFLVLAILGISIEILTPGLIIPSTIGIIAGLFAFLALSTLPINPIGIIMIFMSLGFFVAEALVHTKGAITVFGLFSLVFGSIFLYRGGVEDRVNPFLIAVTTTIISPLLVFIANRVVTAQRKRIVTGSESFEDSVALVRKTLDPEGMVLFQGELWNARIDKGIASPGDTVVITGFEGLKLFVAKERG